MTTAQPPDSPWGSANKVPPLGLSFVAAALEENGFQVEMLDNYLLNKPVEEIKQIIERQSPRIVGIGCSSSTYRQAVETAKAVKEILPSCKVVVGGPHPSFVPESMLQHPEIDFAVIGEGEWAMVELTKNIIGAPSAHSVLADIPSIAYKHKNKIVQNPQRFIKDLDQIPYPARHLLPMNLYTREVPYIDAEPVDTMNVIRGCPYNCNWCNVKGLWGHVCRAFTPSRVVDEIEHLVSTYGSKGIYFVGDNFTINKKRTIEICELLQKKGTDILWACDTGVDLVSRDLLRKMQVAGCRTVWFGVESGSQRILDRINRNITIRQVVDAFGICKEEGIQVACSFMLGMPGETAADRKATLRLAKRLDPDWCQFNIFIAYPGCSIYEEILQKHLYDRLDDFLAYVKTDEFNFGMLLEVQKRFHNEFNRSPKRMLRKIRQDGALSVLRQGFSWLLAGGNVSGK